MTGSMDLNLDELINEQSYLLQGLGHVVRFACLDSTVAPANQAWEQSDEAFMHACLDMALNLTKCDIGLTTRMVVDVGLLTTNIEKLLLTK